MTATGAESPRLGVLAYAILGLLATRSRTGYELARGMKAPVGYMWTARHSQIYPELARLLDQELVSATVVPGRGPRDTKRYTLRAAGREALRAWVDSPLEEPARNELLLRVRSMWLLTPDRARAFLEEQRERYLRLLDVYADEEDRFAPELDRILDPASPSFAEWATLRYGIMRARDTIAWLDWMLEQFPAHPSLDPVPRPQGCEGSEAAQ